MRIMYIEDNLVNVSLVKRVARMGNHEVVSYMDGKSALTNFERDHPDLVLIDIQLAGVLDGLEVVKKLRDAGHRMPIIAITAYAMIGDRERCLQAGCDDYLAKPVVVSQLVQIIDAYKPAAEKQELPADPRDPKSEK